MNLVPKGTYRAVAVRTATDQGEVYAQFGKSKEKGTPQVCVNFELLGGDWDGVRLPWIGYFTPTTEARTLKSLRFCGWKGDDLVEAMTQELDNEVQVVVGHNEYNGKTFARIEWVNAPGGGGLKIQAMEDKDLRMFAAKMKARAKTVHEVAGKKASREEGPIDDSGAHVGAGGIDEIPF